MNKLAKAIHNPWLVYSYAAGKGLTDWVPDGPHLKAMYRATIGKRLNLDNPVTFNEKLQWLKIHDRNPLYTTLVDKYRVKQWVADRIGAEHVTPTYAMWERAEDIDISGLPERFVLKTNHDCGGVAICRDRATFDLDAAKGKLAEHLKTNYFWRTREWPYKDVNPCVFAEEYLDPDEGKGDLTDCKVMCFDGKVRCEFTCTDRAEADLHVDFFDEDWNHLPFTRHYPNAEVPPEAPARLKEMVVDAERLSAGIPFVRVDFYEVAGQYYFGEMTFYPGGGMEEFDPERWDDELGSWIELPESVGGWLLLSDDAVLLMRAARHSGRRKDGRAFSTAVNGTVDYKFYCFGGEPRFIYVSQGLEDHATARISFLAMNWEFEPFGRDDYAPFEKLPEKPDSFKEMTELARELAVGIPFVRADFFEYKGDVRFSEMTFHPCAGFMPFDPPEWDEKVGNMLKLNLSGSKGW